MAEETSNDANQGMRKILIVSVSLCLVCSVIVSAASVALRPLQEANRVLDKKRNILLAADLYAEDTDIDALFAKVEPRLVNLSSGEFVRGTEDLTFEALTEMNEAATPVAIPPESDVAKIKERAEEITVFLVRDEDGIRTIILPVYGRGLYSTLYGFIALNRDGNTIQGVRFYDHRETPGLGGEITNPTWLAKWQGKHIYDEKKNLRLAVIKGPVDPNNPAAIHQIDGLSGATMTSRGVSDLMTYWLGEQGFERFLNKLRFRGG